jgi:UDP-N-acetyl-D-glucosamine dehydrogenase
MLMDKIESREAVVGFVGLGYVGLPLMRTFWDAGFPVLGFDTDPDKVERLRAGENYIRHHGETYVSEMHSGGRFDVTTDFSRMKEADAILLCVPTPLGVHLEPDLSYVEQTTRDVAASLRPGQLVVLESTTYPGTTRQIMLPVLEQAGLTCGENFFLAYSPEREDPGRKDATTASIPKLVGGLDEQSGALATALYRTSIESVVEVSSAEVAEAAKILENVYRAVNIALVNEMKVVFSELDIDVWEVIDAAKTKPFGFQAFYPGPGLGGHCIPIDPFYLTWKAREAKMPTRFIELAGEINHRMPRYVVERTVLALNEHEKAVRGSHILVLGLAYKPDVDDTRESPSFELIEELRNLGAQVDYNDPHVPRTGPVRKHDVHMESVDLYAGRIAAYDCVIIATDHSAYDWESIAHHAKLVVDTRGALRHIRKPKAHVVQA